MKEDARNMNDQPDRFELFTLEEGEEKITMEFDPRLPNTAIFTFAREDHTLGNLLQSALLETEHVIFAAYKVPHPLFPTFQLRVQTDTNEFGPKEVLEIACKRVIEDLNSLSKQFTREWELCKLVAGKEGRGGDMERDQRNLEREEWRDVQREREREKEAERNRERERKKERNKGKERVSWEVQTPPRVERPTWETESSPQVQRAAWEIESPPPAERPAWEMESPPPAERPAWEMESPPPAERPAWAVESSPQVQRAAWEMESPPPAERPTWQVESPPQVQRAAWQMESPPQVQRAAWEVESPPQVQRVAWEVDASARGGGGKGERAPWGEGPSTPPGREKAPWEVETPPRRKKAPWED